MYNPRKAQHPVAISQAILINITAALRKFRISAGECYKIGLLGRQLAASKQFYALLPINEGIPPAYTDPTIYYLTKRLMHSPASRPVRQFHNEADLPRLKKVLEA